MQNMRIKKCVLEESAVWEKSGTLYTFYGKLAQSPPAWVPWTWASEVVDGHEEIRK
jgi:hypothetical protein